MSASRESGREPSDASLVLDRARAVLPTDRPAALGLAREAVALAPADHTTLLDAAVVMLAAGDAASAAEVLTQLVPFIDNGPPGFLTRALGVSGYVKLALGDHAQAERALSMAFDADPAPKWATELAPLLMSRGRPDEARAVIERALAESPEDNDLRAAQARMAGQTEPVAHRTADATVTWHYGDRQRND